MWQAFLRDRKGFLLTHRVDANLFPHKYHSRLTETAIDELCSREPIELPTYGQTPVEKWFYVGDTDEEGQASGLGLAFYECQYRVLHADI